MTLDTPPSQSTPRLTRRAMESLRTGAGPIMVSERGLALLAEAIHGAH